MNKKNKSKNNLKENIISSVVSTILSVIYIIIVKNMDVRAIGPNNSSVGLSSINSFFKELLGNNMTIYKITEIFGLIALLVAAIYGIIGLLQLVKRKSIKKVDKKIIALGILYVLVGIVYVLFEKVVINYRPVIIEGELEASFPSSHTMMAICICVSAIIMNKSYIKNKQYLKIANIALLALMLIIVVGRFISGVHWFSDIIGGIIISVTLLNYYFTINDLIKEK